MTPTPGLTFPTRLELLDAVRRVEDLCRTSQDVGEHYVSAARVLAALRIREEGAA